VVGTGLEIDFDGAKATLDRGCSVLLDIPDDDQGTEECGLSLVPDNSFDTVVLSETLQVMKKPHLVLAAVLRAAPQAVVSFPNFGYLPTRTKLMLSGRMPKDRHLPHEWYDTPNIHLFTYKDFVDLCRRENIVIREVKHLASTPLGRALIACGHPNAGAERVIARIERCPPTKEIEHATLD
jgi:methionine biosynthesis protein MetW